MRGGRPGARRPIAVQNQYPNPRPLELAPLRALLQRAFAGDPPAEG